MNSWALAYTVVPFVLNDRKVPGFWKPTPWNPVEKTQHCPASFALKRWAAETPVRFHSSMRIQAEASATDVFEYTTGSFEHTYGSA
jgi:hypothetical protein